MDPLRKKVPILVAFATNEAIILLYSLRNIIYSIYIYICVRLVSYSCS